MKSSEIIKRLKKEAWILHNIKGSHHQFKHPDKNTKVTVPRPKSELPIGTLRSIYRQVGWEWRK